MKFSWLLDAEDGIECWESFQPNARTLYFIILNYTSTFVNLARKNGRIIKRALLWNMIFSELNSLCQVDLIDFQSQPDWEYKFIMAYQSHLTKFVIYKSLTSKRAQDVAYNLGDIIPLLGTPSVLQSYNGREFVNNMVTSLKKFWSALRIINGKPCHLQSKGSVERANQDIENILCTWMQDNKSRRWNEGLHFVQVADRKIPHFSV